jgi:hypothetical protein
MSYLLILGAIAKLRKATDSFVMSVCALEATRFLLDRFYGKYILGTF